jgi:hypothetical protein
MPPIRHRLEHCLILLDDYLHPLFGANADAPQPFLDIKRKLGESDLEGYDAHNRSYLALILSNLYRGDPSELNTYDENIKKHLDAINAKRPQDEQITLKYFQLLALLYTEHVLHRVVTDLDNFLIDLNQLVERNYQRLGQSNHLLFTRNDLTKFAYWMATGSGKTLLFHINYHQILHYVDLSGSKPFENILLITPNAGLSQQHLNDLELSGISAQPFQQSVATVSSDTIQLIEITKFTDGPSGPQTVNIDSFEGNNLIFVDEGHRGASGDVWFRYRDKLSAQGYTFEYSATFGEALNSGNNANDIALRHSYGKSIVFDYRYRYFYDDGYGKDYTILNLPESFNVNDRDILLLANLLTFYEQMLVFRKKFELIYRYNIERPLLIFVGHTVQTGKTRSQLNNSDKESLSDVLDIVRFLNLVTSHEDWTANAIDSIFQGRSGLTDKDGNDVFRDKFPELRDHYSPNEIFSDLLELVFSTSAPGSVHLSNLRNAPGEISLRVGNSDIPFGVINIGDDLNFLKMAEEKDLSLIIDPDDLFRGSLFDTINLPTSNINILVGAKKFSEGWNSWRVSGMGLLNVGRSEGSEVIQMFGRGVRLKGYQRSLKRSSILDGSHPAELRLLETLNIFSVNGDYLSQFREALDREGILEGFEEIFLPIRYDSFDREQPELFILRTNQDKQFVDQPSFSLELIDLKQKKPVINLTPRIQVTSSVASSRAILVTEQVAYIQPDVLGLLNWDDIYMEILTWRRNRNYLNIIINREVLRHIFDLEYIQGLEQPKYFKLLAEESLIQPVTYEDLFRIQSIALSIIKQYIEAYYNYIRFQWEAQNLEYRLLDKNDPNMKPAVLPSEPPFIGHIIKVALDNPDLIKQIESLIQQGTSLYEHDRSDFPNIVFDRHLYIPLISQGIYNPSSGTFTEIPEIKSVPIGLNEGETRFVSDLRENLFQGGTELLGSRKIYLLRNQSRGKGIGFFDAIKYYPDFILWILDDEKQKIVFIDPKGLRNLRPNNFDNPKIQLFEYLRSNIESRLNNPNISLDSYIITVSSYDEISLGFGDPNNPYSPEEYLKNHVLFPENASSQLLTSIL